MLHLTVAQSVVKEEPKSCQSFLPSVLTFFYNESEKNRTNVKQHVNIMGTVIYNS